MTARRDLERRGGFRAVSPAPGRLDEHAFADACASDPDEALALLGEMAGAVDPELRRLARRLAGRVMLRLATPARPTPNGRPRLTRGRFFPDGDVDMDAGLDEVVGARATGRRPAATELPTVAFRPRGEAVALVVDRSGSMGGAKLATAALAAAAVAQRAGQRYSVVAFAGDATVVKALGTPRPPEAVVDDLLALRGHGSTDLALGLEAARAQLEPEPLASRAVVVLSDCRHNGPGDPVGAARWAQRLVVVAPAGDAAEASAFAAQTGGVLVEVAGPSDVPAALAGALC